jgi:xanthine dehydrogenase accessory factor
MKEFLSQIEKWKSENKKIMLARVIQTWGSSPRPVGSCMLISSDMEMMGSVSGGCVEGAVLKEAKTLLETGEGKRLDFGVTDDDAWAVGLSCGGKMQAFVQTLDLNDEITNALLDNLKGNLGCILITRLNNGVVENSILINGELLGAKVSDNLISQAQDAYVKRTHRTVKQDEHEYFIQVFPPRSKVIIIGAAHITVDLIKLAPEFDFETIVIDPRKTFSQNTTFPVKPDRIFESYPSEVLGTLTLDPYTYCVILSHDPKIDDDALRVLLRSNVAYIGALGSRKNHEKRTARLSEQEFTMEEIAKIDAPIGIDIQAIGAKEIALSIMGAIVKSKNQFLR